jgi:hypothetical protein
LKLSAIENLEISPLTYLILTSILAVVLLFVDKARPFVAKLALFVIGVTFGWGLMIAGMSQRTNIYGFLGLNRNWDPTLLFVLMTGVMVNLVTFTLIRKLM